ncbi:SRPBCC family protein [Rathayibacter sp. VKM Ac-2754]|uniref:SRPBCC family protein n=1 Tax=Rathayibacter sp. VKM Ac-2754 TaxID=2609251 RepID=UPI00135CA051|nr:SRPBCC domain-containing protein [Rathayibacter sp. VKM Ac-2754]MWV59710.1 activator of HSP90 ATPase [Rathayibacter sp. VKM Ac-2754]
MGEDSASAAIEIEASPQAVWQALVDRAAWWPELRFEPVAGSPLRETWSDGGESFEANGHVVEAAAPERLEFDWREPGWKGPLTVRILLSRSVRGTRVEITEEGFTGIGVSGELRHAHERGWRYHLGRLREACTPPPVEAGPIVGP